MLTICKIKANERRKQDIFVEAGKKDWKEERRNRRRSEGKYRVKYGSMHGWKEKRKAYVTPPAILILNRSVFHNILFAHSK